MYFWVYMPFKLFILPDKSQIEKKIQELEGILMALQKNSVSNSFFSFFFVFVFFVFFVINRSDRINTEVHGCMIMLLETGL